MSPSKKKIFADVSVVKRSMQVRSYHSPPCCPWTRENENEEIRAAEREGLFWFRSVMEVPGALGKDMAAILRKAPAYADHLDMRSRGINHMDFNALGTLRRQRLAVCLVNYSYRMRPMIHSKAVGLATPALGASSRCRR
jgi:hypothetical protein